MDNVLVIVDDEPEAIAALQRWLEMEGYVVFPAATADDAMGLVELHRPVGVILDLGMPVVNGFELARLLRDRHGSELPIVAVTGWSAREDHERAELAGVDFVLVKPVDGSSLRQIFPTITAPPGSG